MGSLSSTSDLTSQAPISTRDPTPPGSWPSLPQEDGSDTPAQSISSQPQTSDTSLPSTHSTSTSAPQAESSIVEDTRSRMFNTRHGTARTGAARPHRGRYEPSHPNYRLTRDQLREIAESTLDKLDSGFYVPPPFKSRAQAEEEAKLKAAEEAEAEARARALEEEKQTQSASDAEPISTGGDAPVEGQDGKESRVQEAAGYDHGQSQDDKEKGPVKEVAVKEPIYSYAYDLVSKVEYTNAQTEFYAPDDPFISNWSSIASGSAVLDQGVSEGVDSKTTKTRILIREYSTLVGARRLHALIHRKRGKNATLDADNSMEDDDKIGILNFASAKKPGGGFLSGAQAQEESLARTSTLFPSLITATSSPFYEHYRENKDSPTIAYYTHAMIYSPSVVLFRNDKGLWLSPLEVDILTSAAVNAGEVRERVKYEEQLREERERWEQMMAEQRKEQEEERMKEQEEWEAVLKDNEDLKRRYGDSDPPAEGTGAPLKQDTAGNLSENIHNDVDKAKEHQNDTNTLSSGTTISTTTPSSIQIYDRPAEKVPLPDTQEKEKEASSPEPTPLPVTDPLLAPEVAPPGPVDLPSEPKEDPMALAEQEIEAQMQERIARILALFASPRRPSGIQDSNTNTNTNNKPRTPHLILGSFGTGVFQNHVPLVARIFYDLLARRGAPFAGVFETVVFAILGTGTVNVFREVFAGQSGVPQDDVQAGGPASQVSELDGRVEVVLEGQDEDENALEMQEEVGSEEEGVLRAAEDSERRLGGGDDVAIDIDEVQAEATEIEMGDGTEDSDESTERGRTSNGGHDIEAENVDVEMLMLDTGEDVHVHPTELGEEDPTSPPTSP